MESSSSLNGPRSAANTGSGTSTERVHQSDRWDSLVKSRGHSCLGAIAVSQRSQESALLAGGPLSVLAVVSALVGQAALVIVAVAFMAVAGGVAKVASDFQSEFGTSSSGTSDGEIMLVVGSMILFVFAVSIIAVALKLYGGSWKAWFGAVGLQGFFLLVGLYMVIEASGTWVLGLIGPVIIAGMLMLPDARTWVATESSPT